MNLPQPPDHWSIEQLTEERTAAIGAFGFSPRQARFLVEVLIHSGVFVERQYCQFAGITHGQKTTDFLHRLVERGYAHPIATGAAHRGRLFHVHHKPLYAAIDQADNRHRKRMPMGRMIERLMVLDAVVADRTLTWLGTEFDKRSYFMRRLRDPKVKLEEYPRLTFGTGPTAKHRYFPDKLPIGIDREDHVFVYLVTSATPMEFRLFLLRHAELLRHLVPMDDSGPHACPLCQRDSIVRTRGPGDVGDATAAVERRGASVSVPRKTAAPSHARGPAQSEAAITLACVLRTSIPGAIPCVATARRFRRLGGAVLSAPRHASGWSGARRIREAYPPVLSPLRARWRGLNPSGDTSHEHHNLTYGRGRPSGRPAA